jgi:amino-acid N-acetyltransferase
MAPAARLLERAKPSDLNPILELLARNTLPIDGVAEHLDTTIVAREAGKVIGCAALEIYGTSALLRSVSVAAQFQGRGLGHQLTEGALRTARSSGITEVYLLTTTAERFFPRLGFEPISRSEVPASVQASVEFTSACPTTAVVMRRSV